MSLLAAHHTGRGLGAYVFGDDLQGNPDALTTWGMGPGQTVWEVAYFGPLTPDPLTRNGLILSSLPQLSHLSRVADGE